MPFFFEWLCFCASLISREDCLRPPFFHNSCTVTAQFLSIFDFEFGNCVGVPTQVGCVWLGLCSVRCKSSALVLWEHPSPFEHFWHDVGAPTQVGCVWIGLCSVRCKSNALCIIRSTRIFKCSAVRNPMYAKQKHRVWGFVFTAVIAGNIDCIEVFVGNVYGLVLSQLLNLHEGLWS